MQWCLFLTFKEETCCYERNTLKANHSSCTDKRVWIGTRSRTVGLWLGGCNAWTWSPPRIACERLGICCCILWIWTRCRSARRAHGGSWAVQATCRWICLRFWTFVARERCRRCTEPNPLRRHGCHFLNINFILLFSTWESTYPPPKAYGTYLSQRW